jgi:UDP-N-acetyl-D-mannosaminuronic acid dehydrogenase
MNRSISIIGGLGHVGLPLCLVLADSGYRAAAIDRDEKKAATVRLGKMPFVEYGADEVLTRVVGRGFTVPHLSQLGGVIAESDTIIVTIGTPLDEHLNPRLEPVINCISDLLPHLRDGQHLMLRSTVFPGTTRRVDAFLRGAGKKIDVSFCPERIVQGDAIKELRELPAIVSGCTPEAVTRAKAIFQRMSGSALYDASIEVTPEEAELAKLYLNSWRYIQFAAANQFYAIADKLGADYSAIRKAMTWRYPRGESLPGPGFAAGPCLVKDTMQLAAAAPDGFQMGVAARQANEGLPALIVAKLRREMGSLSGKTVGILGMAFKSGIDDTRDSLSFKLKKLLEFQGATVLCSDEYATGAGWVTKEEAAGGDAVIVAVAHSQYRGLVVAERTRTVDLWDVLRRAA